MFYSGIRYLDALVLDLQNRRAVRANDLQLEEVDGQLQLKAADASVNAILRRISFGLYITWRNTDFTIGSMSNFCAAIRRRFVTARAITCDARWTIAQFIGNSAFWRLKICRVKTFRLEYFA